ncbi:cytochrome C biogenesis protein [Sphingomonas turrisvirgatae]|uniref:Cytochrome c-type biogenesis protein n=2 Tax=Sphingomonas turrisvirgatae TaxID=1888892 RepID=A0A1E3LR23_9SPHN|nr:cytochrome c-type biogenesis protein [Sphingomonas turrisvirgatae]ODP36208.1 cytochrome C biogenesis protein [Sphingomonas turrisvirgatae]
MSMMIALALTAGMPVDLGYAQIPDATKEAQAAELMAELRCLVCQGQSIHDSDVDMAADMRRVVRQKIAAGEKPSEVRAWLIERYGSYVTYDPPLSWATAPLWLAPLLLLAAGLWLARGSLRRRRRA